MLVLLSTLAHAQSFTVESESVIDLASLPGGAGAPAVTFDPSSGVFTMIFETEVAPPAGCSEAWGLRKAYSSDGVQFTVHPRWRVNPQPLFPCGARHPSAIQHDDGTRVLFFQALDRGSSDGVGLATNALGRSGVTVVEDLRGLLEPTAVRLDGEWAVMGVVPDQGVVLARSTDLVTFTVDAAPAIANDALAITTDGFAMPSLGCTTDPMYPWLLYFGGWSGTQKAWAWGAGDADGDWFVSPTLATWTDDSAWEALDYLTDGPNTLVYFETDLGIGVARSGSALNPALIVGRDCTF